MLTFSNNKQLYQKLCNCWDKKIRAKYESHMDDTSQSRQDDDISLDKKKHESFDITHGATADLDHDEDLELMETTNDSQITRTGYSGMPSSIQTKRSKINENIKYCVCCC